MTQFVVRIEVSAEREEYTITRESDDKVVFSKGIANWSDEANEESVSEVELPQSQVVALLADSPFGMDGVNEFLANIK